MRHTLYFGGALIKKVPVFNILVFLAIAIMLPTACGGSGDINDLNPVASDIPQNTNVRKLN